MFKMAKGSLWIGLVLAMSLVFTGCAGKEKTDEEKLKEAIQKSLETSLAEGAATAEEPPSVESKLGEIQNFVTSDIWNEGFVNISWYANSGTGSTGETLDIDFVIERLGKAMEKKAEYDTYVQGLDAKYDDVKQVWTKLSGEIDTLYAKLKENPPKAEDPSYEFDTGPFKQYSEAFSSDVEALESK